MIPALSPAAAMAVLARETARQYGAVPSSLAGHDVPPGFRCIADDCFMLRCESGYGCFYRPGEGITIERPDNAVPDEEILWLNGSVYAGVACLNGFLPFHASAVAHAGRVFAFTGARRGRQVDPGGGTWDQGLPLVLRRYAAGRSGRHRLGSGDVGQPLTFDTLVFLAEGPELAWEPIGGAQHFALLADWPEQTPVDPFASLPRWIGMIRAVTAAMFVGCAEGRNDL